MSSPRALVLCGLLVSSVGCIVEQPLGERDAAIAPDAPSSDSAPSDASAPPDTAAAPDAPATTDATPPSDRATADATPADGTPPPPVQAIDVSIAYGHPNPANLFPAGVGVRVVFRRAPVPEASSRVVVREGDCVFEAPSPRAQVPATPVGPLRITATPAGGAPVTLVTGPMVDGPWELEAYSAQLPELAVGTRVRVEVPATASSPAFARDLVVSDTRFTSPTPITESDRARYFTMPSSGPLQVAWTRQGDAPTVVGLSFNLFTAASEAFSLRCTSPAGATSLTVPASVLSALSARAPMGVGGVSGILTASAASTASEGGVTVVAATGNYTVAGTRF